MNKNTMLTGAVVAGAAVAGLLALATPRASADEMATSEAITIEEIETAQKLWGEGIVAIGEAHTAGGDPRSVADEMLDELYAFDHGPVLFKPTKAAEQPFRSSKRDALSYFVTGHIPEDGGFALNPWTDVRFENDTLFIDSDSALAMGHYFFTDPEGNVAKVEYTKGYIRGDDGGLRLILQHSSLPFSAD